MSGKANANKRFLRYASFVVETFFLACAEIYSCSKQKSRLLFIKTECLLTLILLTWRIGWAPNNASRWQMGFNLAFKGLKKSIYREMPPEFHFWISCCAKNSNVDFIFHNNEQIFAHMKKSGSSANDAQRRKLTLVLASLHGGLFWCVCVYCVPFLS